MARNVVFSNSPQEAAVSRLLGPAQGESLELSQQFTRWLASSERHFISGCELEGSAGCGPVAAARGQLPIFRLKPRPLNRVDVSASEGPGHLFWACVQAREVGTWPVPGEFR